MVKKIAIVFQLFKKPFLAIAFLYFLTLLLFIAIIGLKDAYKINLEKEFATKQPHIILKYIDNNQIIDNGVIDNQINQLKNISQDIKNVSPFIKGEHFFSSLAFKEGGNAQYSGNIIVIGVGTEELVYDFFSSNFITRKPFEVPYTPLEFLYAFRKEKNIIIFNNALFNSYFPVIQSVENINFTNNETELQGKLSAILNDYNKEPILYTSIPFANKLLKNKVQRINGFLINTKDLNNVNKLIEKLKKNFHNTFIVESWLEQKKKQYIMFLLFDSLSYIVVSVILLLSILFIILLLYNAIVKKSYQISVLFTLGYIIKKEIVLILTSIIFTVSAITALILYNYFVDVILFLELQYSERLRETYYIYIVILNIIFILISYLLIRSVYKMKTKSLF